MEQPGDIVVNVDTNAPSRPPLNFCDEHSEFSAVQLTPAMLDAFNSQSQRVREGYSVPRLRRPNAGNPGLHDARSIRVSTG